MTRIRARKVRSSLFAPFQCADQKCCTEEKDNDEQEPAAAVDKCVSDHAALLLA